MGFWAKLFGFEKPRSFQERYPHIHHALTNPEPPANKATSAAKSAVKKPVPPSPVFTNTSAYPTKSVKVPPKSSSAKTRTSEIYPSTYETASDDNLASDLLQTGLAMNALSPSYDDTPSARETYNSPEPVRENVDSKWYAPEPESAPSRNDDYCAPSSNDSWSAPSSNNDPYSAPDSSPCDTGSTSTSD